MICYCYIYMTRFRNKIFGASFRSVTPPNKFVDLIKLAKEQCGIDFDLKEKQLKCMEMVVKDRTVLEFFLQDMESL